MTPEQLLMPRYKVIADYPFSEYKIGQVLRIDVPAMDVFYAQFPAIFRRMNWAEERKPEDLPDFVKDITTGIIYEIIDYAISGEFAEFRCEGYKVEQWMPEWLSIDYAIPATEAEYLAQQK